MPAANRPHTERYQQWLAHERGIVALECCQVLLRGLLAGWPRRSRSMLMLNAGSAAYAETLWEAGFDLTVQDNHPDYLDKARQRLGRRAEFVLSAPEHLPFEDCAFDYAVAAAALEFWDNPADVLREMQRLACSGIIVLFPNAFSLFGLECRLAEQDPFYLAARPLLRNPRALAATIRSIYGKKRIVWTSVLPGPSWTWRRNRWAAMLNTLRMPVPIGAFAALRIDFGPLYTGTPLPISVKPVASG